MIGQIPRRCERLGHTVHFVPMDWLYYTLLLLALSSGLLINLLGLPGLWLMVIAHTLYAWTTDWHYAGAWSILTLVMLGLTAELAELLAGSAGAAKAGGSRRGMISAVIGAFIGAIVLTPLIPLPVIGTIAGACAGAFLGAGVIELCIRRDWRHSVRVALGAAKGRFWGIVIKTMFGVAMLMISLWTTLPIGNRAPAAPPALDPAQHTTPDTQAPLAHRPIAAPART